MLASPKGEASFLGAADWWVSLAPPTFPGWGYKRKQGSSWQSFVSPRLVVAVVVLILQESFQGRDLAKTRSRDLEAAEAPGWNLVQAADQLNALSPCHFLFAESVHTFVKPPNVWAWTPTEAEEKLALPKMMKRKKSPLELPQEAFKRPLSGVRARLVAGPQVFYALGKRSGEQPDPSPSRALVNSSNPKGPQARPVFKPWLDTRPRPREGKGPVKSQAQPQNPDGSSGQGSPPPSQDKLPYPGKVNLVPSAFPPMDKKPPARPVPRMPQSWASRRPAVTNPAKPAAVTATLPTPVCSAGPGSSAQPMSTSSAGPGFNNPARPPVPRPPASRPGPYTTSSCASRKREPVHSAVSQPPAPPRPHNHCPLQHFTRQPILWRTPEVLGPVMSIPIANEQRPEREAMKRKAQLERENAARLGNSHQHFTEREEDMANALYYGYAM